MPWFCQSLTEVISVFDVDKYSRCLCEKTTSHGKQRSVINLKLDNSLTQFRSGDRSHTVTVGGFRNSCNTADSVRLLHGPQRYI